jgi:hypothetical protein
MSLGLTAIELARIQFAFTVSFHIIFPAISIGLASFLAVLEWRWLRTNNPIYQDLFKYWVKIFAVAFGMGVVSGVVMSYQFGTNWSEFSRFAGGVTGPLLTYEVLSAFFLEAGFLGIMLFGWGRVSKRRISLPHSWSQWEPVFQCSGFYLQTVGCKHRKASPLKMALLCHRTGLQLCLTHLFLIALHTWQLLLLW